MERIGGTGTGAPTADLGAYRARDGSAGARVRLDLTRPHAALVVGKRGSGKSYTLGVLAEALARADGIAPVVADPMGVFGSLTDTATGRPVPATVVSPRVPAGALGPREWCELLGLDPAGGPGALVWRAAESADAIDGMRSFVADADAGRATRRAAANHLRLAASWGVFGAGGLDRETLRSGAATVLDLAGVPRRAACAVVAAVARSLYDARVTDAVGRFPWLLVDEAHVPFDGVAGPALRRLVTRGRAPGVSLVAATQRPSALPPVAVSQSDLLVVHRLTGRADREALSAARPSYVDGTLGGRMPTEPGEALVVDEATESVHPVSIRERDTPHGGTTPRVRGSDRDREDGEGTVEP